MKTFNNLNDLLAEIKGARVVSLRTSTQVKANKKSRVDGSPFPYSKGVSKLSVRNVILGSDYSNVVNNQLVRENKVGDFNPESLWRGKGRKVNKFICEHTETGEKYLSVLPVTDKDNFNVTKSVYVDNESGLEIDPESLKDFLPPNNNFESEAQGTDKVIHWQVLKLSNILAIKSGDLMFEKV